MNVINTQRDIQAVVSTRPSTTPDSSINFQDLIDTGLLEQFPKEAENFERALANFYQIHQRSQITGVPTTEYNNAVRALGLDPDDDPLAGIKMLEQAGFTTGSPTIGAILEHGATPQAQGNQSYLAQAPKKDAEQMQPNYGAIMLEINELNEQHDNLLGSAQNYFEAAQALAGKTEIQPYSRMTLGQALPLIQAASQMTQSQSTLDWIARRQL